MVGAGLGLPARSTLPPNRLIAGRLLRRAAYSVNVLLRYSTMVLGLAPSIGVGLLY